MILKDGNIFWDKKGNQTIRVGQGVYICYNSRVINTIKAPCLIARNVRIDCREIGSYTFINEDCVISNCDSIGNYCAIGPGVKIGLIEYPVHNFAVSDFFYNKNSWQWADNSYNWENVVRGFDRKGNILIGNDVWIGANATVLSGVVIGDGAIIGENAVVCKDVSPYSIVGSKGIKYRFEPEIIEELLQLKWWQYKPQIFNGLDLSVVDHENINLIKSRLKETDLISNLYYIFDGVNNVIEKVEDEKRYVIYDEKCNCVQSGGISIGGAKYDVLEKTLTVKGWFLPDYAYDRIEVYGELENGEKYLGNASLRHLRLDVLENYGQYGNARSGWLLQKNLELLDFEFIKVVCKKGDNVIYSMHQRVEVCNCVLSYSGELLDKNNVPSWMMQIWDKRYRMIEYIKLKQVSEYIRRDIGELLKEIKKKFGRKLILTFGNCQILSLNPMIASSNKIWSNYILINVPPVQSSETEEKKNGFNRSFLEQIDLFIYQLVQDNNRHSPYLASSVILNLLNKNCTTVCIPNAYYEGYFPQHCHNNYNPLKEGLTNGIFPYGDKNIERLYIKEGKSNEEIYELLSDLNYYTEDEINKNHLWSLQELINRENRCDVTISDFIQEKYKSERLFFVPNHPSNMLMYELLRKIMRKVDLNVDDVDYGKTWENNGIVMPIYPSVEKVLRLKFKNSTFCYHRQFDPEPVNFVGYIDDYIKYCFKENENFS